MEIRVQRLGPNDSTQYREIRLESLKAHPGSFGSSYDKQLKLPQLMFEAALKQPVDSRFLVGAFDRGEIVGICGYIPFVSEHFDGLVNAGTLIQMYVREAYRGRAIGLSLVETLMDEAFKDPLIEQIVLGVRETNINAIRVYERAGFRIYQPKGDGTNPGFVRMIRRRGA